MTPKQKRTILTLFFIGLIMWGMLLIFFMLENQRSIWETANKQAELMGFEIDLRLGCLEAQGGTQAECDQWTSERLALDESVVRDCDQIADGNSRTMYICVFNHTAQ